MAFGEAEAGSSAGLFRAYSQRLDDSIVCRSEEDDPNIVIQVVFECPVKITSLLVIGGPNGHSPTKLRLFANHPNPDFSTITECGWETQVSSRIDCLSNSFIISVGIRSHRGLLRGCGVSSKGRQVRACFVFIYAFCREQ